MFSLGRVVCSSRVIVYGESILVSGESIYFTTPHFKGFSGK